LGNTTLTAVVTSIPTSSPIATSTPASTPTSTSTPSSNVVTALSALSEPSKNSDTLLASKLKWPEKVARADSEKIALQSLFKLYGLNFEIQSKGSPCQQVEIHNMRCFAGHGGLTDLVQIDQPVLLRLLSADGKEYSATLTALDHQSATLMVAGEVQRVSLMELANSWFGQYVVVWHVPPDFDQQININDQGPSVMWLRHALEKIEGASDHGADMFDAALAKRVHAFQLAEGIQPDGVVGPLTVIHLNLRSGMVTQRLVTIKKG
jgi:general secretion pathway protein A